MVEAFNVEVGRRYEDKMRASCVASELYRSTLGIAKTQGPHKGSQVHLHQIQKCVYPIRPAEVNVVL